MTQRTYPTPSTGHVAPYWTKRTNRSGIEDVQIKLWTGYSWLEHGSEDHVAAELCVVLSEELELEEYDE